MPALLLNVKLYARHYTSVATPPTTCPFC